MGRKSGKLKVEFIENWKTRNTTFKRRREGVLTKAKELSTLCDVSTCLILYAPDHDAPTAPPSVWPPNDPALIGRLIRAKNPNSNSEKDDDETQLVVRLDEIAQQIRAEIDRLKSDQQDQFVSTAAIWDDDGFMAGDDAHQQDQDQFGHLDNSSSICQVLLAGDDRLFGPTISTVDLTDNSSTAMMPRDDDGFMAGDDAHQQDQDQFGHLDNSSSICQVLLAGDDRLFGPTVSTVDLTVNSSTAMMPRGPLMVDDRTEDDDDEQRGLIMGCNCNQSFAPFLDSYQEEEEDLMMMMMRPLVNDDAEMMNSSSSNYGNYYPQQQFGPVDLDIDDQFYHQYQFGPVDLDPMWLEEEENLMMVRPVVIDELMKQREPMSMGGSSFFPQQLFGPVDLDIDDQIQQYQFGPVDLDPMWLEEEDLLMVRPVVIDDMMKQREPMGCSSSCQHPQQQQQYELFGPASSSAAADDDLYLYDDDDGEGLITQLYTPPRQSTDLMFR